MKTILLSALLVCPFTILLGQQLDFARTYNQVGSEASIKTVHDHSGNLLLTGVRQIIAASGGTNGASNTWVRKYDTNGQVLWTVQTNYTGTLNQEGAEVSDITVDSQNNTYITGTYVSGSVTLGGVTYSEPANANLNLFYAKISPAGTVLWIKGVGETAFSDNVCMGSTITATPDDELILTGGYFKGITIGSDVLPGNPALSGGMTPFGFYAKLDTDGNPVWAKRFSNLVSGAFNSFSCIRSAAADDDGNLFFLVGIDSAVVFGNDTISSSSLTAVVKTGPNGQFIRAVVPQATYNTAHDIALDACGNLVLLGDFIDAIQVENTTLTAATMRDVFVVRFNNDLDLLWMRQFYSTGADLSGRIACNDRNDVFFNFEFWGELNLDGPYSPAPLGTMDVVLIKLDSTGNVVWHKHSSGTGNTSVSDVSVSPSNTVVFTGRYQGQEIFDGAVINGSPGNLPDVWLAAYTDTTLAGDPVDCSGSNAAIGELQAPPLFVLYPNPAENGSCTIRFAEQAHACTIEVSDILGKHICTQTAVNVPEVTLSLPANAASVLLVKVIDTQTGNVQVRQLINR